MRMANTRWPGRWPASFLFIFKRDGLLTCEQNVPNSFGEIKCNAFTESRFSYWIIIINYSFCLWNVWEKLKYGRHSFLEQLWAVFILIVLANWTNIFHSSVRPTVQPDGIFNLQWFINREAYDLQLKQKKKAAKICAVIVDLSAVMPPNWFDKISGKCCGVVVARFK